MTEIQTPKTTEHVTVFATTWCPFCKQLIAGLEDAGIPFDAWDVEEHDDLSEWVKSVNNGNRIVPTVLYSDGTTATNPPAEEVAAKYAELNSST